MAVVSASTCTSAASSTSSTATGESRSLASALTSPVFRLAPVVLWTIGPAVASAAARSAVVVVFPLVPDTRYSDRPAVSLGSAPLSTARATRPPMTAPLPRPVRRDTVAIPPTKPFRA